MHLHNCTISHWDALHFLGGSIHYIMNMSPSGKYCRPTKGLGGESSTYLRSKPMGLVFCFLGDDDDDDDEAVLSLSIPFFEFFPRGLNDSCLMSSSAHTLLLSPFLHLLNLSGLSGE